MLYDFITAEKSRSEPMYRQIDHSIRSAIESGSLKKGTRLPSIRKLSESLGVSKTTVTAAYDQLCAEGYIVSKPQSGYLVAAEFSSAPQEPLQQADYSDLENKYVEFDFSGKSVDPGVMNLADWRKAVKDVINRDYLLTSYGDAQGEEALRHALQKYALGTRSVNSSAENIVVGAGTQPVLLLLCALLGEGRRVAMEADTFVQSELVFRSMGYEVSYFSSDGAGVTVDSLECIRPDILLINPNFSGRRGAAMPVTRRLELIEWAKRSGALILEDDYNGELRYSTHPVPCVQHYDSERVVYIGSFSKVMLPSVRISYMVLPEALMNRYRAIRKSVNQTASKTEQLALAVYINSRKIDAHLRRARRIYLEKSAAIHHSVRRHFPDCALMFNETSLYVSVRLKEPVDSRLLAQELERRSVRLIPHSRGENELGLSFSGIPIEKIEDGVALVAEAVEAICGTGNA